MRRERERDAGAAVVEFTLISMLLIALLFGVLQVGVYFYARNIIEASAADAARYAAAAGTSPAAGGPRAHALIAQSLGSAQAAAIRCVGRPGTDSSSGLPVTTVRCTGKIRALAVAVDLPMRIDVVSSALKEQAP